MFRHKFLITAVLFWSSNSYGLRKFIPQRKDLEFLLREPPLKVDNANRAQNEVEELWLEQKLDHFTAASDDNRTWSMRYLRNAEYFAKGGPIFIFVGGEWEISNAFLLSGHLHDMAQQHAGMLYYTEHRYYGKSWPKGGATVQNLKYLNVQQALADLAYFIKQQKATNADLAKSKVILTGGSYAGSMATWFMKLYPGVATASWASSAPLVAKLDFCEYMEEVGKAIKLHGGSKCYKRIAAGMNGLVQLLETSEGTNKLLERFQICDTFNAQNDLDIMTFFNGISNYFSAIVQSFKELIKETCNSLMSLHGDDLETLMQHLIQALRAEDTEDSNWCLDFSYASMKEYFADTEDTSTGARTWFYQTCNEFGWYTITDNSCAQQPFARQVPLRFFQQLCEDLFDSTFSPHNMSLGIQQTNNIFAGNTSSYPNVIFTHGQLDPWRAVGAVQSGQNVIVIPGYSHTADLDSIDVKDSVAMNIAKLKVSSFLYKFLRQAE